MEYTGTIKVTKDEATWINKILTTEPQNESECFGENESFSKNFVFENDIRLYVDICGVQYEESDDNTCSNLPYTQATLNDKNGNELAFTEPSEDFFGEWEFEYNNDTYVVNVVAE